MRTEYTIRITDKNGKVDTSVYPKQIARQKAEEAANFYTSKGYTVELFKVRYNGSSFYDAEKIF